MSGYQQTPDDHAHRSTVKRGFALDLAPQTGIDTPHDIPQGTVCRLREPGFAEIAFVDEITDENAVPEDATDLAIPISSALLVQTRTGATAQRVTPLTPQKESRRSSEPGPVCTTGAHKRSIRPQHPAHAGGIMPGV
ncbi:MAG: hypothetical protein ACRDTD_12320 [Pseudonocardiaceae bacterium]